MNLSMTKIYYVICKKMYLVFALISLSFATLAMDQNRILINEDEANEGADLSANTPASAAAPNSQTDVEEKTSQGDALAEAMLTIRNRKIDIAAVNKALEDPVDIEGIGHTRRRNNDLFYSHLCESARRGDLPLFQLLHRHGARLTGHTLLHACWPPLQPHIEIVNLPNRLIFLDEDTLPRLAIIKFLLTHNVAVNFLDGSKRNALMNAALTPNHEVVRLLLNQPGIEVEQAYANNQNALNMAKFRYEQSLTNIRIVNEKRGLLKNIAASIEAQLIGRMLIRHLSLYSKHGRISKNGVPVLPKDILKYVARFMN